jgi:hypothetical protein
MRCSRHYDASSRAGPNDQQADQPRCRPRQVGEGLVAPCGEEVFRAGARIQSASRAVAGRASEELRLLNSSLLLQI